MYETKKYSVLVVDDEDSNIVTLTQILSSNYTVYTAINGQGAVKAAQELLPDIILLDIVMPEMDGYAVLTELIKSETTQNIPVVFITELNDVGDEEKGLTFGAADYITKPFSPGLVRHRIINQIKLIEQIRINEQFCMVEQLTKIPNRRNFDDQLHSEWRRAAREQTPISILFIEADDFASYEETHGYQQGDIALQAIAVALKQPLKRAGDFAAHWNRERFAVLLPNTDLKGSFFVAEQIRKCVEEAEIPCPDKMMGAVTVSIGINTRTHGYAGTIDDFIHEADKALYIAKENGRNMVYHFETFSALKNNDENVINGTKKYSVLVIDDENSNIMTLTHILSNDYTVYAAKNGHNALTAAEKYMPDIILLDIIMPEIDGYAVIAGLKKSVKTINIPVIFITGLSNAEDEEKGLSLGAADYITKPFSPALVKLRVLNQIKLIEQFRVNEYDIMKYKLANDALHIALWDMDVVSADPINPNNKFTWSQEFRQMLGFSDESDFPNVLFSWSNRLHPEDKEKALDAFEAHLNDCTGKTPYNIECRLMLKNGEYRTFQALGATRRDSAGVPLRVAGALMDINERQKLEEARMTSRAKSAFLANMSHEIRTPMNAILGITEILLQDEALRDEQAEGLGRILNSCDMLLGIINDILDFSKIEAGKLDIIPAEYNIASLINDLIQLNMTRAGDKPIDFEVEIDENIPSKLIGDVLRIKQIMNNLLSNAFKYTDSGKVILAVDFEAENTSLYEKKDVLLVLSVRDTGYGMTAEQVNKIFDEYSRFYQESGRTIEGTGLGLSITHRLTSLMDGNIHVESELGKGSLFVLRVPQGTVDNEVLGKELAENLQQFNLNYIANKKRLYIKREPMPYGNVLIVDDVEMNLYVAEGLMKPYKLQTNIAMSGFEVIDKIESGKVYDIIFMDHMMPKMDGMETTKILRALGYTEPIVALTANALVGQAEVFLQNGFDAFISKPIDTRRLDYILNKFIRDKQQLDIIEAARWQEINKEVNEIGAYTETPAYDDLLEAVGKINAINTKIGLHLLSGEKHMYCDTLEIFCKKLVLQCGSMAAFLEEVNMEDFSISVHAIKSQLATIGAVDLSDTALKLEMAAKLGDIDICKELFPDFQENLLLLHEQLLMIFPAEAETDKESGDAEVMKEGIKMALVAAGKYDNNAGISAIEPFLLFDFGIDTNSLLEEAVKEFNNFDCEKAGKILSRIKFT